MEDQNQILPQAEPTGAAFLSQGEEVQAEASAVPAQAEPAKDPNVELQGKIGDFGSYSVDVKPEGDVVAGAEVAYEKAFAGFVKVKGIGKIDVTADLLGGILALAEKSDKLWLKGLATKLRTMTGR